MRFPIIALILALSLDIVRAQEDPDLQKKYTEIFGTPDQPLVGTETKNEITNSVLQPDCKNDDGEDGYCVVYYQCNPDTRRLIADGSTLLDIRIKNCPRYFDVCCLLADVNSTISTPAPATPPPSFSPLPVVTSSPDSVLQPDCKNDDGEDGYCVVYYQCNPDTRRLIADGSTLLDIRIKNCPRYFDVCCLLADVNSTISTPAPATPPPSFSPLPVVTSSPATATSTTEATKVTKKPLNPLPFPTPPPLNRGCGYSNLGAQPLRIVNTDGAIAEYGEFPWMIAMLKKTEPGAAWTKTDFLGGGTLIHPSVVLTAAHKVDSVLAEEMKVRAGEWDTQNTKEEYPYQERDVTKIITHENFYRPAVLNCVSLLILAEPFSLARAPHIGIACLGQLKPPPGTLCYGMGWGKDDFNNDDKYAVLLKKVELPLIGMTDCQNTLKETRLGPFFRLHPSLTCAGGKKGQDTCAGDGGSPLVCHIGPQKDLRYAVYGATAWGIGCGTEGLPGVYVNLPEFYSWIGVKMAAEGFKTDSYTF